MVDVEFGYCLMSGYVPKKLRSGNKPADTKRKPTTRTRGVGPKKPSRPRSSSRPDTNDSKRRPSPKPSPGGSSGGRGRGRTRRAPSVASLRRMAWRIGIAATVFALLAAGLAFGAQWSNSVERDARSHSVTRAAETAASALFSYDYRDFDASIKNGTAHTAGDFSKQYASTTEGLRESATKENAQVAADVVDAAIIEQDTTFTEEGGKSYDGVVEVLVFLNQTTKNANIEGKKVDTSRVVLTMLSTDEGWKAVNATAF